MCVTLVFTIFAAACLYMISLAWSFLICYIGEIICSSQKAYEEVQSTGSPTLVFAQGQYPTVGGNSSSKPLSKPIQSSFKGRKVLECNSTFYHCSDGASGSLLPLEMSVRIAQRETSGTLPDMWAALDHRDTSFEFAEVPRDRAASTAEMGAAGLPTGSKLEAGCWTAGRGSMGQITTTSFSSPPFQFKQGHYREGSWQNQAEGCLSKSLADSPPGAACTTGTAGRFADVPGSPLAHGPPTSHSACLCLSRLQCYSGISGCQCSRSKAQVHVRLAREASRGFAPGYPEGDEGYEVERRGGSNQIATQAGKCLGQSADRAAKRKRGSFVFALLMAVLPGRAGFQMAGLLPAVPATGDGFIGASQCSTCSFGNCPLQPGSFQILAPEGPATGPVGHPDGQRRRRGVARVKGGGKFERPEDYRQSSAFGRKLEDAECQCRRDDARRATGQQAPEGRAACWSVCLPLRGSAFSSGRACMTREYDVQWPYSQGTLPDIRMFEMKWQHSIVQASDFCSEWEAAHRASELALQFGGCTFHPPICQVKQRAAHVGRVAVTFCPSVEVLIGVDDSIRMHSLTVPAEVLDMVQKPWSDRRILTDHVPCVGDFQYERDLGCPIDQLFDQFLARSRSFEGLPCCHAVHCPVPSACGFGRTQVNEDPFQVYELVAKSSISDLSGNTPVGDCPCLFPPGAASFVQPSACQPDLTYCQPDDLACPDLCCDPLSSAAVSIPEFQCFDLPHLTLSVGRTCLGGVPLQHPTSAGSSSSAGPPSTREDVQSTDNAAPIPAAPLSVPPFALAILRALPVEFQVNPARIVRGVLVRSWLLNHVTFRRSMNPRQALLRGPPHLWRAQLLRVWFQDNIPQDEISIDLVQPTPPRNWHETAIVFDIVLAQGVEAGRRSGLVTVSPTFVRHDVSMYAVAVSLAPTISGQDLVTDAGIQDVCNVHACLIFQDQFHLPIDFARNFVVQPGAGFVVYVSLTDDAVPEGDTLHTEVLDPAPEPQQSEDQMLVDSAPARLLDMQSLPSDPAPDVREPTRRITVYRLGQDPISAWVRLARFSTLVQDILEITALQPSELVAIHRIHAKPVGELQHETSFIIQHQGDIPPGSADQLVLLDVVFHQQGPATHPHVPAAFDRRVIKVPSAVSRAGLLELARVAQYCEFRHQACVVLIDHLVWHLQDLVVRLLSHGTYGRLHIPPPSIAGAETCRTVSLVEDVMCAQSPTFAQVYPSLPTHTDSNMRAEDSDMPPPPQCFSDALAAGQSGPLTSHLEDQHQTDPPEFLVSVPAQAPPVFPNAPQWQQFELQLRLLFDEHSHTDLPEEGPVLHVITWFVHHDRSPSCLVGRLVRLSHRPFDWLQQLCTPWLPMMQPFLNLAFHIVRPNPASHIPGQQPLHVILEQGIQIARQVALFSVLFHGIHGDITHRRAQSIPPQLSRDVILRILGIDALCNQRRCSAWAGRLQFHRSRLEPVSQGLGISITVAPFRNRFAQVDDDGFPIPDTASSSQIPPRISFRPEDASLFPNACWAEQEPDVPLEHAPSRLIPDLRVIWERYLMTAIQRPYRFYVETWFCDHERFPRTNRGREVQLPPDQDAWRAALIEKWRDLIDPTAEVFIYVVDPQPFGGPSDTLAHIILAQHQQRGFVSALITTLAPGDDPWDPPVWP